MRRIKLIDLIFKLTVIFFLSELFTMFVFSTWLNIVPGPKQYILDAVTMLLLSTPFIYILIIRREREINKLDELDRQLQYIINKVMDVSLQHTSQEELFNRILTVVIKTSFMPLEPHAALFLLENNRLVMKAQIGLTDGHKALCAEIPLGKCLCGLTAQNGRTVFEAAVGSLHEIKSAGMPPHGHYCVPIKSGAAVLGVLTLYVREKSEYNEFEASYLETVCSILAKIVEFKKLEQNARQLQKMESLGRFASAIAHDFNNILAGIKGFNALAIEDAPADARLKGHLALIESGVNKGTELTTQLLTFSRKQPQGMSELDLGGTISSMQKILEIMMQKKVKIRVEIDKDLFKITGNKSQIEQLIMNLAVNARDAMPDGGEFRITAANITNSADTKSCLKVLRHCSKAVRLTFEDTGPGLSKEVLNNNFEPFFTTKPEGKGTGLGLSTVYTIATAHNGCIDILNEPGKGACFQICIPVSECKPAVQSVEPPSLTLKP